MALAVLLAVAAAAPHLEELLEDVDALQRVLVPRGSAALAAPHWYGWQRGEWQSAWDQRTRERMEELREGAAQLFLGCGGSGDCCCGGGGCCGRPPLRRAQRGRKNRVVV